MMRGKKTDISWDIIWLYNLILTASPWSGHPCYYLTDEEKEAQRGFLTGLGMHNYWIADLVFESDLFLKVICSQKKKKKLSPVSQLLIKLRFPGNVCLCFTLGGYLSFKCSRKPRLFLILFSQRESHPYGTGYMPICIFIRWDKSFFSWGWFAQQSFGSSHLHFMSNQILHSPKCLNMWHFLFLKGQFGNKLMSALLHKMRWPVLSFLISWVVIGSKGWQMTWGIWARSKQEKKIQGDDLIFLVAR